MPCINPHHYVKMKIFGIRLTAKKEPRYASYADVQALSELVTELTHNQERLYNAIEAIRKKIYREDKKEEATEEMERLALTNEQPRVSSLGPGDILTPEQMNQMFGGG